MTQTPNTTENEKMTLPEFEQRLPEFFATGTGSISDDPRLHAFLQENPDAAALVRDFEAIVEAARGMFDTTEEEPSDAVWQNIQTNLSSNSIEPEQSAEAVAAKPLE